MNVMLLEWHNRELNCPARICPYCHSEEMFYSERDNDWQCEDCRYRIDEDTKEKYFETSHLPPFKCPECGWHILDFNPKNFYGWYCPHCFTSFCGTEKEGPDRNYVAYAERCPTCGERAVRQIKDYGLESTHFKCQHCKMRFDSIKNKLVRPRFCRICEKNTVVTSFHDTSILECKTCKQKYNKDMDRLDANNQVINENINETTIEDFSLIVGSEYDNSLHHGK